MEAFDYCQFFKDIEKDPMAPVNITVRQYRGATDHVLVCEDCYDRAQHVVDRYPESGNGPTASVN